MEELKETLKRACQRLFDVEIEPQLTRPDEKFGDYSTNVAFQLAPKLGKTSQETAEVIVEELRKTDGLAEISVAGPGFLNIKLTDEKLGEMVQKATDLPKPLEGQEILVEFGDPNPFKQMHIGHLYSYIVGDGICRLLEASGAKVQRLSYHGDVGLHIAKAMYGLRVMELDRKEGDRTLSDVQADNVEDFLGIAYAYGNEQYGKDPSAKTEIEDINKHVYSQDDSEVNDLHKKGIDLSFRYFDKILDLLSISNNRRYFESETVQLGLELVRKNLGKVFQNSQGAIIYDGEKKGLHTRVFITSQNLPTYETKDLGLAELKRQDFPKATRSVVITGDEQSDYFRVMLAALSEIKPELAAKTTHLAHGFLSLTSGKMSSRTGNVYSAADMLKSVEAKVEELYQNSPIKEQTFIGAVKYTLLKHRLGQDIVVNVEEAASLEGNSGPYLQYAFARANSILKKSTVHSPEPSAKDDGLGTMDSSERSLARKISEYPEVVAKATAELMPHHLCTYLYELAQTFNQFYEKNRVIGDPRQNQRFWLLKIYADVLKSGLSLLNIEAPDKV